LCRVVAGNFEALPVFVNTRAIGSHDKVSDCEEVEISTRGEMGACAMVATCGEVASDFLFLHGDLMI
jgi:hypothetical protein